MTHSKSISLRVCEEAGIDIAWPLTRGVYCGALSMTQNAVPRKRSRTGRSNPTARTLALARRQHQVDTHRLPNRLTRRWRTRLHSPLE